MELDLYLRGGHSINIGTSRGPDKFGKYSVGRRVSASDAAATTTPSLAAPHQTT
jgi:hypothetical protein